MVQCLKEITVFDDDAPELSITAEDEVLEAEEDSADFTISAKVSPVKNIEIHVLYLEESEDFIDSEGPRKSETLIFTNETKTGKPVNPTQ